MNEENEENEDHRHQMDDEKVPIKCNRKWPQWSTAQIMMTKKN